jgi:hypothetical protein
VTLESALPYLSIGCAIGAGAAAAVGPSPGVQRTLKSAALFALALFAFLRGVAPAALAMALVLSGLSAATAPRERSAPNLVSCGLSLLSLLVLAWLCLRDGVGLAVAGEPLRLGLTALAVATCGALGAWIWRGGGEMAARALWAAEAGALALLLLSALTLRDSQWPALAGAAGLLAAHALNVARARRPWPKAGRTMEILAWLLSYLGLAAMAYVFLR